MPFERAGLTSALAAALASHPHARSSGEVGCGPGTQGLGLCQQWEPGKVSAVEGCVPSWPLEGESGR